VALWGGEVCSLQLSCCIGAVPFLDSEVCNEDGMARVRVGQSPGHIFYDDQTDHSTSTIRRTTPTPADASSAIPLSSPGPDWDPRRRDGVVLGEDGCPWTLSALPGQRVRLRVILVHPSDHPVMDTESHDIRASPDACLWTLVIRDSALISTVHLPVCCGRQRDSQIYLSIGHRLSIHVEQSEGPVEWPGKARMAIPTTSERGRRSGFLLTYECKYRLRFYMLFRDQSINQSIKIYFLSNRNITVYYSVC